MTTGNTIVLTVQTFVDKVMSLFFNTLSSFVTAVLPRNQHLLNSWLKSPFVVILEPKKIVSHCLYCFPSISCEVMGPDAMIFIFLMLSFKSGFSLSSHFHQEAV